VITAYHTIPAYPDPNGIQALRSGVDIVTFTSGSTARNFITLVQNAGLDPFHLPGDPLISCIGPKTAMAVREAGFRVDVVAQDYTVEGLIAAIQQHMLSLSTEPL
jgi:uroporphyrinogen-III synthase